MTKLQIEQVAPEAQLIQQVVDIVNQHDMNERILGAPEGWKKPTVPMNWVLLPGIIFQGTNS